MTILFGSAQTNGLPLLITAITQGTRQLLHTFPAGSATPDVVQLFAINLGSLGYTLNIAIEDSGGTILRQMTVGVPVGGGMFDILSGDSADDAALIQNGASTVKVWADTASVLAVTASVDNQASSSGAGGGATVSQNFGSGLVAAVQNANRFAFPAAQGGVGTATEVNANQMISRAGILRNLRAKSDATVGGGATITVAVRVNGASSALTLTIAAAQTTVLQSNTASISVAIGDLVTFLIACDNAGAPAANIQAACEYQAQ